MIRRAVPEDVSAITDMIYELAAYQNARDECNVTTDQIRDALFGPLPSTFAHVAVDDGGRVVGIAVWFRNFSTWDGTHGIYLEDLFVNPADRGSGHGKALLATLARECVENGYTRLSWSVIKWNTASIAFYESLGAYPQDEWITYRLTGDSLGLLASEVS
ncbi:GNAT family N-acetyltransferase [Rhodococcus sp. WMMA185]|uniref:GNAT family N-acetyltransferase n=1 Tax=Rhodococcus sp. WMMA185 TaxID=679318 RepID=UPI000878BB4B|nr:GNAT family N-acetyltransferase [Rhodococcus sp. WMMA185]AOW92239.1 GNAT family N-acetyltransferase [Rhodococcus sp. WMMA185]